MGGAAALALGAAGVSLTPIVAHDSPSNPALKAAARGRRRRARVAPAPADGRARASREGGPMDRFLSHFTNRFDAKGRISVPAPFRAVLAKDGFDGLFVHPSLDAPALDCGGNALLERNRRAARIRCRLIRASARTWRRRCSARARSCALDSEGRIVLSERPARRLALTDEAAFVGHGHKFQIWEPITVRGASRGGQGSRAAACGPSSAPGGASRREGARE